MKSTLKWDLRIEKVFIWSGFCHNWWKWGRMPFCSWALHNCFCPVLALNTIQAVLSCLPLPSPASPSWSSVIQSGFSFLFTSRHLVILLYKNSLPEAFKSKDYILIYTGKVACWFRVLVSVTGQNEQVCLFLLKLPWSMCSYKKVYFFLIVNSVCLLQSWSSEHAVKILAMSAVTQACICPWQVLLN